MYTHTAFINSSGSRLHNSEIGTPTHTIQTKCTPTHMHRNNLAHLNKIWRSHDYGFLWARQTEPFKKINLESIRWTVLSVRSHPNDGNGLAFLNTLMASLRLVPMQNQWLSLSSSDRAEFQKINLESIRWTVLSVRSHPDDGNGLALWNILMACPRLVPMQN